MNQKSKTVKLVNLSKTFETTTRGVVKAVRNVNLTIEPGEFVTLLGPSGCGKTTLLRMIAGFEMPTEGKILFNNEDIISKTPDKRGLGMVFQNYALFPHLNVFKNVAYGLKIQKLSATETTKRVKEGLEIVKMDDFENRVPAQMSGGQQQRIALVRALVLKPGVLLFDEPLSNLDAKLRLHMRDEIRRIQQEMNITSIYVTHDQSEAMAMSDKVVILNEGIIEQVGTPREVYQKPANEFVANFIGKANFVTGKIEKITDSTTDVNLEGVTYTLNEKANVGVGDTVKVVIRPDAVNTAKKDYSAKVVKSIFMGDSHDYWVEFGGKEFEFSDYYPATKKVYNTGETITFGFDEDSIHILGGA